MKALDNRFYVKFMQLEIGLLHIILFVILIYVQKNKVTSPHLI